MKKISFTLLALIAILPLVAQTTAGFDGLGLPLDSFWNGSNLSGSFTDGHVSFNNKFNTTYQSWSGFAYSTKRDAATAGYTNQYSSSNGGGVNGSSGYVVSYAGSTMATTDAKARLQGAAIGKPVNGMYVTNSTFAYFSMKNGDQFAKKFGGATGTDPDWFRLNISGWYNGAKIADSVQYYLADFRSPDTLQHYISKSWTYLNLLGLGNVDSLYFTLESSDTAFGYINTPAYFCLDNFKTTDGAATSGPIAVNDTVSVVYHDSVSIHILANDTLTGSGPYTVTLTSGPQVPGAYAYVTANNNIEYIPAIGIRTQDTLRYMVCDPNNLCSNAIVVVNVLGDTNTSIANIDAATLSLYPDPAHSYFNITGKSTIHHVAIIDMTGREVLSIELNRESGIIHIADLSAGLYTALVYTSDGVASKRFVKE